MIHHCSDYYMRCPSRTIARFASLWGSDVFMYLWMYPLANTTLGNQYPSSVLCCIFPTLRYSEGVMGALVSCVWIFRCSIGVPHSAELPFVFGTTEGTGAPGFTPEEKELSLMTQRYWIRFAAGQHPNSITQGASPPVMWPSYKMVRESVCVRERDHRSLRQVHPCDANS